MTCWHPHPILWEWRLIVCRTCGVILVDLDADADQLLVDFLAELESLDEGVDPLSLPEWNPVAGYATFPASRVL